MIHLKLSFKLANSYTYDASEGDLSGKPSRIFDGFLADIRRISGYRVLCFIPFSWGRNLTSYPSWIFHPRRAVLYYIHHPNNSDD